MSNKKSSFSIMRIFQLIGVFIGICLVVLSVLKIYSDIRQQNALERAEAEQVGPQATQPADALSQKDDFYRIMAGGIQANDASNFDSIRQRNGGALHKAFQLYVKKDDVLARTKSQINKGSWSYNIFAGSGGPYWSELIEWCIRLRMPAGGEKMYAYTLGQLSDLVYSESIGLPKLPANLRITPDTALNHIKLDGKQELLIPMQTRWFGRSAEQVTIREWFIMPESRICQSVGKK